MTHFDPYDENDPDNWDPNAPPTPVQWQELYMPFQPIQPRFSYIEAWSMALLRPSVKTYTRLIADPYANMNRVMTGLAMGGAVATFLLILMPSLARTLTSPTVQNSSRTPTGQLFVSAVGAVCAIPFGTMAYVVLLFFSMFAVHLAANAMGGAAAFTRLAYALSLASVPLTIMVSLSSILLAAITVAQPTVAFSLAFFIGMLALAYYFALSILSIRVVHQVTWPEATMAALAPAFALYACGCSCLGLVLAADAPTF